MQGFSFVLNVKSLKNLLFARFSRFLVRKPFKNKGIWNGQKPASTRRFCLPKGTINVVILTRWKSTGKSHILRLKIIVLKQGFWCFAFQRFRQPRLPSLAFTPSLPPSALWFNPKYLTSSIGNNTIPSRTWVHSFCPQLSFQLEGQNYLGRVEVAAHQQLGA